nr:hypothetical protein [Tanacetum cinerariifolium]
MSPQSSLPPRVKELGFKQESEYSKEDQGDDDEEVDWIASDHDDEEKKDDTDDDKSIDLEMTDDEETEDEFVQGDEKVYDDEDEEVSNVEVEDLGKGDTEISDAAKADVEKTEEVKDVAKKAELPLISSSLSVSLVPVPSLEVVEMTVDSSRTLGVPPVPSHEPPVPKIVTFLLTTLLQAVFFLAGGIRLVKYLWNIWDICRDGKCREAHKVLDYINDNMEFFFFLLHSGF